MTELITEQVRAKSVSISLPREDKGGRVKDVPQHVIPMKGMFSAKEAEKVGLDLAKELGVSDDSVRVETYKKGEAPMEANPRHRGYGHHWDKQPSEAREVVTNKPTKVRRVFSGWTPMTPEEIEQFYANKEV